MTVAPQLPFERPNVLEIAPLYDVLRREGPIVPVRTPAGDPAWLVTSFEHARAVFADDRFRRSHPAPERASRISDAAVLGGPDGDDVDEEQRQHTLLRTMLVPAFSASRMRRLTEHVTELAERCMDDLRAAHDAAGGAPVNLSEHLSLPLPVLVICELLGVPFADREYFGVLSRRIGTLDTGGDPAAAMDEFAGYMGGLIERKRHDPQPDVLTDMVRVQDEHEHAGLSDDQLARLAAAVLLAGHETTANNIDLGVLGLLNYPAQRAALAADPQHRVHDTVEEILRIAAVGGVGLPRYAHADVQLGGVRIARGDAVLVSASAANRDAAMFERPDEFDPERGPNLHIAFGYGPHFCVGASLARTELRAVFGSLFGRFPDMRLGVDIAEIEVRTDRMFGGVTRVPVTW